MAQSYQVGTGDSPISLAVIVGTVGVAYSEFSTVKDGTSSGTIAASTPQSSGNIEQTAFGTASEVLSASVIIHTLLDFSHLTAEQRESALATLVIAYAFSGGIQGGATYTFDRATDLVVSANKKMASVTAKIVMV